MHGKNWCCFLMLMLKDWGSHICHPSCHCKAVLYMLCLKQAQKNLVPNHRVLCVTMQAERICYQWGGKEPFCSASRTVNLIGRHSTAQSCWKECDCSLPPLILTACWGFLLLHSPGWALVPHQPQWTHGRPRAEEKLQLLLPEAAHWDPPLKGDRLVVVPLGNAHHSRPFLPHYVIQEGERKKVCAVFFLPNLFLCPIFSLAYLSLFFTLFYFCCFLLCSALCHIIHLHPNVRGMYAQFQLLTWGNKQRLPWCLCTM